MLMICIKGIAGEFQVLKLPMQMAPTPITFGDKIVCGF